MSFMFWPRRANAFVTTNVLPGAVSETLLTLEAFSKVVANELDLVIEPRPGALLAEELGLDSLDLYQLVMVAEELAQIDDHGLLREYPVLVTLSDAYLYYQAICSLKVEKPESPTIGGP